MIFCCFLCVAEQWAVIIKLSICCFPTKFHFLVGRWQNCVCVRYIHHIKHVQCAVSRQPPLPRKRFCGRRVDARDVSSPRNRRHPPPVDEAPSRSRVDEPSTRRGLSPVPPPLRPLVDLSILFSCIDLTMATA